MQLVSKEEIAALDKFAVDSGLTVTMMMEHAGLHLARFLQTQMIAKAGRGRDKRAVILVGSGHNGGDGIAAARFLANWGHKVDVLLAEAEKKLKPTSKRQLHILRHIANAKIWGAGKLRPLSGRGYVICDALIGYPLEGDPKTAYARLIKAANNSKAPTIACDIPSGLSATKGSPSIPTINAEATVTLAAVKKGLKARGAKKYVGKLYLADLGIPEFVYKKAGIEYPGKEFKDKSIIKV